VQHYFTTNHRPYLSNNSRVNTTTTIAFIYVIAKLLDQYFLSTSVNVSSHNLIPESRQLPKQKKSKVSLELSLQIIQSFVAVGVLAIAIYGLFFSKFSQIVEGELRSSVERSNLEIIELTATKDALTKDIETQKQLLTETKELYQKSVSEHQVAITENQRQLQQTKLEILNSNAMITELKQQKWTLRQQQWQRVVSAYKADLWQKLDERSLSIELAVALKSNIEWADSLERTELKKIITQIISHEQGTYREETQERIYAIESAIFAQAATIKNEEELLSATLKVVLGVFSRLSNSRSHKASFSEDVKAKEYKNFLSKLTDKSFSEFQNTVKEILRNRVTDSISKYSVTGAELLSSINSDQYQRFLDQDSSAIMSSLVKNFTSEHSQALEKSISLIDQPQFLPSKYKKRRLSNKLNLKIRSRTIKKTIKTQIDQFDHAAANAQRYLLKTIELAKSLEDKIAYQPTPDSNTATASLK